VTPGFTCREGVEKLMDYLEGALGSPEREAIDAHVAGCPRCVAFVESYVETPRIWRAATARALSTEGAAALRHVLATRR
jgi:anti-sigma factor RsiW